MSASTVLLLQLFPTFPADLAWVLILESTAFQSVVFLSFPARHSLGNPPKVNIPSKLPHGNPEQIFDGRWALLSSHRAGLKSLLPCSCTCPRSSPCGEECDEDGSSSPVPKTSPWACSQDLERQTHTCMHTPLARSHAARLLGHSDLSASGVNPLLRG